MHPCNHAIFIPGRAAASPYIQHLFSHLLFTLTFAFTLILTFTFALTYVIGHYFLLAIFVFTCYDFEFIK